MERRRIAVMAAGITLAMGVAACGSSGTPAWTFQPAASGAPASGAPASATPTASTGGGAVVGDIAIAAGDDLRFTPETIDVAAAGLYSVTFKNTGSILHDITFADGTKIEAKGGETATGEVTIPAGGTTFICSVPGHADAGMKGSVTVAGATASASPDTGDHGGPGAALPSPDPNAPAYTVHDAKAPAVLAGTTHDIDLVIEERPMTVAEGYVVNVWTFNGTVPGPVIRVKQGDTIRIHLKNPATNKLSHSIDFHASQVAWNDEMTSIAPGEEKLYEWRADYAGVWMYHCGSTPVLQHIGNGMYGMVIVEPVGGLEAVDSEYALVQSDWYFDDQGMPISLTKAAEGAPSPDWVTFNGVANQYLDNPLPVNTGKRVRLFVLNAGPSVDSAFHIVGTIFDTVIKEGVQLTPSNSGHYGSQTVDLAPAQGAIIELSTAEDGLYPIVTHAFNFPGRGALGLLKAGDGDPLN
ncbi:MAG TPA: multicopper oxidase domain-containing protein [Candidatus Limnocylindrales bacterium]|nr:multicopper oxidase domain-containing protein [Candidatus Limnocylindrales bacterium]